MIRRVILVFLTVLLTQGVCIAFPQTHSCCRATAQILCCKKACCQVQPIALPKGNANISLGFSHTGHKILGTPVFYNQFLLADNQSQALSSLSQRYWEDQSNRYLKLRVLLN